MKFDNENKNIAWCPGCGDFGIHKALKIALDELNFSNSDTVLVSGIGQAAKMPQYVKANYFNGLHGRALPVATGIKTANKNLKVIVTSGDGDIYGEGGNHFIHAIRRNPDITVIACNNMVYGLTKGQASPTSQLHFVTKTQPKGNENEPFNPIAVAIAQNISFVGRAFCQDLEFTKNLIKQAITHKGFALVDIFQPCPTFNKVNTYQWFKDNTYYLDEKYPTDNRNLAFEQAIKTDKFPLGVFYKQEKITFEENDINKEKTSIPLYEHRVDMGKLANKIQG